MKAIVCSKYGPPEVLTLQELAAPIPRDHQILIRIRAAVVTAADSAMRKGRPWIGQLFTGIGRPRLPVLGCEWAGEVVSTGPAATAFRPGDRVFGSNFKLGAYAEYVCLPEDGALTIMPDNASFSEAVSLCDGALTALPYLRDKGKLTSGQRLLVIGACGAIGSFALQLGKHFGAEVTAVCRGTDRNLATSLGADDVIDYTTTDFRNNGRKYDVIFDAVGKSSYAGCSRSLTPSGIYLTTVPTLGVLLQMLRTSLFCARKAIFYPTGLRPPREQAADLRVLKQLTESGAIRSLIDRSYPLDQIVAAHTYVGQGHKKGSVVIDIQ